MARIVRARSESDSPQSARADGIRWMRGQAADVLAELGSIGPQGEVPPALLTMLNDKDLPIPIRSKAARALGKLKYDANPPAAGPYLTALAEFACDALSSDQPASRARVRAVSHDVEDGLKKFDKSTVSSDLPLIDGLQKTLQTLNRETADRMTKRISRPPSPRRRRPWTAFRRTSDRSAAETLPTALQPPRPGRLPPQA